MPRWSGISHEQHNAYPGLPFKGPFNLDERGREGMFWSEVLEVACHEAYITSIPLKLHLDVQVGKCILRLNSKNRIFRNSEFTPGFLKPRKMLESPERPAIKWCRRGGPCQWLPKIGSPI